MERTIALFIIVAMASLAAPAQQKPILKNQYNEQGQKKGYWVEKSGSSFMTESYYLNGQLSGISKEYHYGRLFAVGEFEEGEMAGTWYYFGDEGELVLIYKEFKFNTDTITNVYGVKYVPKYSCRSIGYHPNGIVDQNGILLWEDEEHPISDLAIRHGEWRFYDDKGNLEKVEIYEQGEGETTK